MGSIGNGGCGASCGTGVDFELGGTIGQFDAGAVSGGDFTLTSGFGVTVTDEDEMLSGDLNNDGSVNGQDIQGFVNLLLL